LVSSAAVLAAGCGGPYDASVTGVVTLDGNAVTSGAVAYIPTSGGPMAYAEIDEAGQYEVYTGSAAGLAPGSYGVTVVSREPPATQRSKLDGPPPPGNLKTPLWYAMAESSPLKFDVEPGDNEFNLELKSTPPPGWTPPPGAR
jgi:hypothetical protein